jgi:hypothetical protein
MTLNERHFEKLLDCYEAITALPGLPESVWVGRSSSRWLGSVLADPHGTLTDVQPSNFSDHAFSRTELLAKIIASKDVASAQAVRDLVLDIFAWGGMGVRNARLALREWEKWKEPCLDLVGGGGAIEAYEHFNGLHRSKIIKGLGPAYYTKLIYFLGKGDGLIMDQWTSRSTNLLFGNFIKIHRDRKYPNRGSVDKNNDKYTYQRYISGVQFLSERLTEATGQSISPARAEELIFSISTDKRKSGQLSECQHRVASAWRRFVMENDRAN